MVEEREVITLLLGAGAFAIAVRNRRTLSYLPSLHLLLAALALLILGWASSIMEGVEGLSAQAALDLVEHACYGSSTFVLAIWAYRIALR